MEIRNVIILKRKDDSCYKVTNILAKLFSSVLWTVEFVRDELGYLPEEISTQSVEVGWFLLMAYGKM